MGTSAPPPPEVNQPGTTTTDNSTPTPTSTPTPPPTPAEAAVDQVKNDVASDVAAVETVARQEGDSLSIEARTEYDKLAPTFQGRIHALLNDIEAAAEQELPALHTFLGAK